MPKELFVIAVETFLAANAAGSRAVAPTTAKLAPWMKSLPLARYGFSNGSPKYVAVRGGKISIKGQKICLPFPLAVLPRLILIKEKRKKCVLGGGGN